MLARGGPLLPTAALLAALLAAAVPAAGDGAARHVDAGPEGAAGGAGPGDAGALVLAGGAGDDAGPCRALEAAIERRKAWLVARRAEQVTRGPYDVRKGVPSAVTQFCEDHPADEDCLLGDVIVQASPDELVWRPDAGAEEYDPHVLRMKRELKECRSRSRPAWPWRGPD